jgi:hypothetical protein
VGLTLEAGFSRAAARACSEDGSPAILIQFFSRAA